MSIGQLWSHILKNRKLSLDSNDFTLKFRRNCKECENECTDVEVILKYMGGTTYFNFGINNFLQFFSINEVIYWIESQFEKEDKFYLDLFLECDFYPLLVAKVELEPLDMIYTREDHQEANAKYKENIYIFKGYCDVLTCFNVRTHARKCDEHGGWKF